MVDYYVNNVTGTSGGSGSAGDPVQTIPQAAALCSPNDSILVVNTGTDYTVNFLINSVSGTAGNYITLRPADYLNPPTMRPTAPYRWQGVSWWILDGLLFDYAAGPGTDNYMVRLGAQNTGSTLCQNFIIRNCRFTHSTFSALGLENVNTITVESNHFLDIRRRVVGVDQGAVEMKYTADNITIQYNDFEDIGSDCIEIEEKDAGSTIGNVTVQYNHFWINRPYGVKSWHDFSTNVGENGIDLKDHNNGDGAIIIRGNIFHGFRSTVAGQDASGASGEAIVLHNDISALTTLPVIENNIIFQCDQGITLNDNTGNGVGARIRQNIITQCDDWAINVIDASNFGLYIDHNTIYNNAGNYLRLGGSSPGTTINSFQNNLVANNGGYGRGTVTGEATAFNNNLWYNNTSGPPSQWQDGTDQTGDPRLNGRFVPDSGSPALNSGADLSFETDFIGTDRDSTPAIGARELEPVWPTNAIVYDDFLHLYTEHNGKTDTNSALWISYLARNLVGGNAVGLKVNVDDTDSVYIPKGYSTVQNISLNFAIDPASLPMAANDDFGFLTILNGTTTIASIRLRYESGNYRIVVRAENDAAGQDYVSTASGNIISDAPHEIDVTIVWGNGDGSISLDIDQSNVASNTGLTNSALGGTDGFRLGAISGIDAGTGGEETFFLLGPITATTTGVAPTLPNVYENDAEARGVWRLEEVSGTRVDSSPLGNDLTDNNTVGSSTNAQEGTRSADFERSTSEYLSITDAAQNGLDLTGSEVTIVAWVNLESFPAFMFIAGKYGTTGGGTASYALMVGTGQEARGFISSNGTSAPAAIGATTLNTGTWYHVAMVYNGTDIRVYVNGALDSNGSNNPLANTGNIFDATTIDFRIGGRGDDSGYFDGLIDEVGVFGRALSADEIQSIYENGIQVAVGMVNLTYSPLISTMLVRS